MARAHARDSLQVALATLGLGLVLYPGALLRGEAFFERDLHLDWYPRMAALTRAVSQGAWPLWEPGLGFGQPLLADPSVQVLYPLTWIWLLLPWSVAYTAFVLVHVFVALLGARRLAARLGTGHIGAWAAGLAFALSGPVQSALNLWHHFAGTAWMPWVLLAFASAARAPSMRTALALAVAMAMQVLAGSADLCAMTVALGLALCGVRLLRRRRRAALAGLAACLAGIALAAAVTCALWWPAADIVSRSSRRDLPAEVRSAWSVPVAGLARLLAPLDPARVPFEPATWTRLYDRPSQPLLYSLYLGLPVLGLALLALIERSRPRHGLLLFAVAAAAVAFAMGPHGVVYDPACALLPPLRNFRYPSKAVIPATLAVALLAGLGVRALARPRGGRWRAALLVLLGVTGTLIATNRLHAASTVAPFAGAAVAVVLALSGARLSPGLARLAVLTLVGADLVDAHRTLNATAPSVLLTEPPPVVEALRQQDGRRVYVWDYVRPDGASERLLGRPDPYRPASDPPGLDHRVVEFVAQRQLLVAATPTFFGLETSFDFDNRGLYARDMNDLSYFLARTETTLVHTRLLRLGAVSKVIAIHERDLDDLRLERSLPSLTGDKVRVFEVPDPQPRAWLVGSARVADGEGAIRAFLDPAFDPREEAVVASPVSLDRTSRATGSVRWLARRADRQQLETTSSGPALLVLADAYDPGWRARVDGVEADVLRANLAFRAVAVPEGRHAVELVYRPRAVLGGLAVSASAAVLLLALRLTPRRRPAGGG
jgi:hypothetical protein